MSQTSAASSPTIDQPPEKVEWHVKQHQAALDQLEVNEDQGLAEAEAKQRLNQFGTNELVERQLRSPWRVLFEQFTDAMILILLAAAIISFFVKDPKDAIIILVIVLLNGILGFTQEYRAEQAMAALRKMAAPNVKVRRDGQVHVIEAKHLVPGDIILLEAGDAVPADGRLIQSANLRVLEASLTGESVPVDKTTDALEEEDTPLGDRRNMVYLGTSIAYGRGAAVVTETGMATELGRIADLIQEVESGQTPLQRRMASLGHTLAIAALGIVGLVIVLGLLRGEPLSELFFTAVALAVAAVPEGLPAVVTISLALGAQRLLRRQSLIRKLPAVETLGSVTAICSDKTGTLTENRMTVRVLDVADHTLELGQAIDHGMPSLHATDRPIEPEWASQYLLLVSSALCNDATLKEDEDIPGDFSAMGDPTEGALLVAAARTGLWKGDLEGQLPRVDEVPFSSERKLMTTVHQNRANGSGQAIRTLAKAVEPLEGEQLAFTKGAVDQVLARSNRVWNNGRIEPIDENWRQRIQQTDNTMAQEGLRVLGVAFRPLSLDQWSGDKDHLEEDLIFLGMVGMIDPPRPEVRQAVAECQTAGIRVVMITGDHPLTALRIAQDLDITQNDKVLTGVELDRMNESQFDQAVVDTSVFARVSPEHKLKIVKALQGQGNITAMTGDGVNDAPALRRSDIGVAMGITGTDVSKEAADMVILDDNFATIVRAVREGRTIYDNIRKFIQYTMTSNAGELLVMLAAPLFRLPLPLTALQILWINLVTDGLPGLALGVEEPEPDIMERPPRSPREQILGQGLGLRVLWIGLLMGAVSLGVGAWGWVNSPEHWMTMVFTTLTLSQMGNALALRSESQTLTQLGLLSNRPMILAVALTFVLQLIITYWAPAQGVFLTTALPLRELLISLGASTIVFVVLEINKLRLHRLS